MRQGRDPRARAARVPTLEWHGSLTLQARGALRHGTECGHLRSGAPGRTRAASRGGGVSGRRGLWPCPPAGPRPRVGSCDPPRACPRWPSLRRRHRPAEASLSCKVSGRVRSCSGRSGCFTDRKLPRSGVEWTGQAPGAQESSAVH